MFKESATPPEVTTRKERIRALELTELRRRVLKDGDPTGKEELFEETVEKITKSEETAQRNIESDGYSYDNAEAVIHYRETEKEINVGVDYFGIVDTEGEKFRRKFSERTLPNSIDKKQNIIEAGFATGFKSESGELTGEQKQEARDLFAMIEAIYRDLYPDRKIKIIEE